jgi:hypothetical protein
VRDGDGQQLVYVYYESEPGRRSAAKLLTKNEARRIAANIAKSVAIWVAINRPSSPPRSSKPHGDPRQISIRFSGYGLERGGKIDRIAVGKIKGKKNAPLRPNCFFEDRLDQLDRFSPRLRTIGEWSVGSSPSMRDPDRIRTTASAPRRANRP